MRKVEPYNRIRTDARMSYRKRELRQSRECLWQLICWMENDHSLDAQPEKVLSLKKLLASVEHKIEQGSGVNAHSIHGVHRRN